MTLVLWNVLTPRFYLALTASSFFISILILLFEWWYFTIYGMSFIEQILINMMSPLFGSNNANNDNSSNNSNNGNDNVNTDISAQKIFNGVINSNNNNDHNYQHQRQQQQSNMDNGHISLDSKIWRNPMSLFRGCEYNRLKLATKREPLTFYDMNLSSQDHQTFFTCYDDHNHKDLDIMMNAWRERDAEVRISLAHKALELNPDCATALILLAEEEAPTVWEAEKIFLQALRAAETQYRRSLSSQSSSSSSQSTLMNHQNHNINYRHHQQQQQSLSTLAIDVKLRRDINVLIYIRRRLAMCARKLGKLRESIKMMRDLIKEYPMMNLFNIHENLIEALLEINAYADVQALLIKYDDINLSKSATICYTSALLKSRNLGEKFTTDQITKRGLSIAEMNAIQAIHRAVEFNPHVPEYLLELKNLIFPPEHFLKRGDAEAIAYAFFHLPHWKRIDGALNLLECFWKRTFRIIPFPLEKGHLFNPYLSCTECTDRELLPDYHKVSVYPKKSFPSIIRPLATICALTALMTFIFYQYPMQVVYIYQSHKNWLNNLSSTFNSIDNWFEYLLPNWIHQCYANKNCWL